MLVVGSTAGHVYPAIAVAEAVRRTSPRRPVLFVAGDEGPAARILSAAGERLDTISGSPIKRAGALGGAIAAVRVWPALRRSRRMLTRESAVLVLGFGSYTAGTVLLAARSLGIRTALHEANAYPGLANRLARRVVDRVYLATDAAAPFFPAAKTRVVGMPVRAAIVAAGRARAPEAGQSVRVLVLSGSRGGEFLAREVPPLLARISGSRAIDVVHQAGSTPAEEVRRAYEAVGIRVTPAPFLDDIPSAYRDAHVVIARGGAGTLAELATVALPSIIVPLADAADDHQTVNARLFESAGAGLCASESTWPRERLAEWLHAHLSDPAQWHRTSDAAARLARPDAAASLAAACVELTS